MEWRGTIGTMVYGNGEVHLWDGSGHSIHLSRDGTCCISENGVWRPGCFENQAAAALAFDLTDDEIEELKTAKERGTYITAAQIRAKLESR